MLFDYMYVCVLLICLIGICYCSLELLGPHPLGVLQQGADEGLPEL